MRPRCLHCDVVMHIASAKTAKSIRYRCPECHRYAPKRKRPDVTIKARFRQFCRYALLGRTIKDIATGCGVDRRTVTRWFAPFYFLIFDPIVDEYRVYDQLFVFGTYFEGQCLLVVSDGKYVVNWLWCQAETKAAYLRLFTPLQAPQIVVTDGQRGVLAAIKQAWPTSAVQRCRVHVYRNVIGYVTMRPKLVQTNALKRLAEQLLKVTNAEQAAEWMVKLDTFGRVYEHWLNEKTFLGEVPAELVPIFARGNKRFWYTHHAARRAYRLLLQLAQQGNLFVFVDPPGGVVDRDALRADTNSLEGGVNKELKRLVGSHQGVGGAHLRALVDMWLFQHMENAPDLMDVAAEQDFGRDARKRAEVLMEQESPVDDGRPQLWGDGVSWGDGQVVRRGRL